MVAIKVTIFNTLYHVTNKYDFNLPIYGKVSEEGGIVSDTTMRNTARDNKTVISKETFSPLSGGKMNPKQATVEISIQGNTKFIK